MGKHKVETPKDPVGRYRELLSEAEVSALELALRNPPPTALRFNPLKTDPQLLADEFQKEKDWPLQPVPFCPDGYTLKDPSIFPGRTLESRLGYFYIQDAASMLPVELFEPIGTDMPSILDLTAAPGGKSTHLASRFSDRGILVANDGTSSRIAALTSTLKTWGAVNSCVTNLPGEKIGHWFPETFDCVLLDAPCSMENLHPGGRKNRVIKPAERERLAQRQAQLLFSAMQACKIGGQVVYSTCTLAPEEDEGVLDSLLRKTSGAVTITEAGLRSGIDAPSLTDAFGLSFIQGTERALRLWPFRLGTSGFFSAHLRKTGPVGKNPPEQFPLPGPRNNLLPISPRDETYLHSEFSARYGFNLAAVLDEYGLNLRQYKQSVYAVSRFLVTGFPNLPANSSGLRVGDLTGNGFEVSLEWSTRFGSRFSDGILTLSTEMYPHWARGEDVPSESVPYHEKGMVLIIKNESGRVAGTGRVSNRGIKNLLPRHLALKS